MSEYLLGTGTPAERRYTCSMEISPEDYVILENSIANLFSPLNLKISYRCQLERVINIVNLKHGIHLFFLEICTYRIF